MHTSSRKPLRSLPGARTRIALTAGLVALCTACTSPHTERAMRAHGEAGETPPTQANSYSLRPTISADGRLVAFESQAANLVQGDTNDVMDIFVHDLDRRTTTRVSVDSQGRHADGSSWFARISVCGRYVAFVSRATNLVEGDTNGVGDVFVHDRQSGRTTRVSVDSAGRQGNGECRNPSVSAGGRFVVFSSMADNLVTSDSNKSSDVFVHDCEAGETTRVSVDSRGAEADAGSVLPTASRDGSVIAFLSHSTNLVASDTNGQPDVFVHDRRTGKTERASVVSNGSQADGYSGNPVISADGRFVAFESWATNLADEDRNGQSDVFVHDLASRRTELASATAGKGSGDRHSRLPGISADGRFVVFVTWASDLISRQPGPFGNLVQLDRETGKLARLTVPASDSEPNHDSDDAALSDDGRLAVFASKASNLVAGDTNRNVDIFLRDSERGLTRLVSVASAR